MGNTLRVNSASSSLPIVSKATKSWVYQSSSAFDKEQYVDLVVDSLNDICGCNIETLRVNLDISTKLLCVHCHSKSSFNFTNAAQGSELDGDLNGGKSSEALSSFMRIANVANRATDLGVELSGVIAEKWPRMKDNIVCLLEKGTPVIVNAGVELFCSNNYFDIFEFLAEHQIRVVASLPGLDEESVDYKLGVGAFHASVKAILELNDLGYGFAGRGLSLDLLLEDEPKNVWTRSFKQKALCRSSLIERFGIVCDEIFLRSKNEMEVKRKLSFSADGWLCDKEFSELAMIPINSKPCPIHICDFC